MIPDPVYKEASDPEKRHTRDRAFDIMNIKLFFSVLLFVLSILTPALAGGDKDDDTIIIGEMGQILYKGGKKVSLKDLIESLHIIIKIETSERTTIRLSSRGKDAARLENENSNSTESSSGISQESIPFTEQLRME